MAIFAPGPSLVVANNLVQATFDCDASAAVGDLVIQSTTTDNKVDVISSNVYDGLVIGVVVEKLSDTRCNIRWSGLTATATGLTRNKAVFVSLTGTPTTSVPTTGHLQSIGTAVSSTEYLLNLQAGKVIRS